jgi:hypothetical protein
LKSFRIHILVMLLFIGSAIPVHSHAQHHVAYMYKNDNRGIPVTRFSPTDTIGVCQVLNDLAGGDYAFHADWYNAVGKLQETSRYRFTKQAGRAEIIDAQLEIIKASPVRRMFSTTEATGFHMKFYGKWRVKLFLNGKEIDTKIFEVK